LQRSTGTAKLRLAFTVPRLDFLRRSRPALPFELKVFLGIALLLTLQSAASLGDGFPFLRNLRASLKKGPSGFQPSAAVIIPCKGTFPKFQQNIRSFLGQVYPRFQIIFVVATKEDPAFGPVARLFDEVRKSATGASFPAKCDLVVAGLSDERGEKVNNLVAGLRSVEDEVEILVFADADASPHPDWLASLVAPLADPAVTVSTGFRWYLPGQGFASQLRAAWDTSIATLLGDGKENFAWGGSMAMRAADFHRLEIAARHWARTVSDDYAVTRAVRQSKGKIHFEPRCLVRSEEESSFGDFLDWANRQIVLTRVYAPHLWRMGLVAHSLYVATWIMGLSLMVLGGLSNTWRIALAAWLAGIVALGMSKARLRTVAARELFPEEAARLARLGGRYWQLQPVVPWIMFWNFLRAGFTRRIEWAGSTYKIYSDKVEIKRPWASS
jgi:ceramide glucosyltransferase